ncbi:molybdopterin-dependent oxidoreductase [Methylocella sp. CPCC 101449]|uniref:nitrate reductase n=1 Tax=Methylocella sp. CPCC 101449 TaxID=2987531 RepID=UPI00288E6321|nr:molybdopterin-dependent oxidoreductase [Methylocella sp. CPCC 101449]MDT2021862.1 molybdopterin-dependent oxidoreductase [Methylocella sp. CPCC 101449]
MVNNTVKTTCPYCGVGCGVLAKPKDDGAEIAGDPDHPANFGRLCVKGSALGETLSTSRRLLYPSVRGVRASWDRAIGEAARGLEQTIARHGSDAVAFYLSGQLLTEDYYVANKLMKGFIGSANVDTNSRLCMASSVAGHKRAFGSDTVPNAYVDLECADLLVLVGSNAAWCHPVLHQRMQLARERGARIVTIDPRRTATADDGDLHLPIAPGMDSVLFSALLVELARRDMLDADFIACHTSGFEAALARAQEIAPDLETVATRCELPLRDLRLFLDWWIATPKVVTCYSQGVNQSAQGTDKVNAILNCHLATGRIGKPGSGPFSLTGQPNAMGGREVGGLANQLAAHMGFSAPEIDRVGRFWNAPAMAQREGLKAVDLFDAIDSGRIKALWIMCTNPAVSLPDADRVRRALSRLDMLIVSEVNADVDGILENAHVIMPAAGWGEKDGTVTNSERRITRQRPFRAPPGEAKPDWWMVCEVAGRMGFGEAFSYSGPDEIFAEHAALSAFENNGNRDFDIGAFASVDRSSYDAMTPFQWPQPNGAASGTERLFADGAFFTPDRKARFIAIEPPALKARRSPDYPLLLNTGRVRDHWHTMTRTGLAPKLARHIAEPFVEVHPDDARRFRLSDGGYASLRTPYGSAILKVIVNDGQKRGMTFAPIHWNDMSSGRARVGALVQGFTDPTSGQPEMKATPVLLESAEVHSFAFILSRQPLELPAWLVHAHLPIEAGHATLIANPRTPAGVHAYLSNFLPAEGELLALEDSKAGTYRSIIMNGTRIEAVLFCAAARETAFFDFMCQRFGAPVPDDSERLALLTGRDFDASADTSPIVCSCHGVRASAIAATIAAGAGNVEAVGTACKAGTNCGSCKPEIRKMLEKERVSELAADAA